MAPITSLADFFRKAEKDERYQRVAVIAYNDLNNSCADFMEAKSWINRWVLNNVIYEDETCESMVNYLNTFIQRMED